MKQLTLFEESYLLQFKPIKHWAYNCEAVEHINIRYGINKRGEVYDFKNHKTKNSFESSNGYLNMSIQKEDGKTKNYLHHRLVACTFLENTNKLKYNQVDHIDEDKYNNHLLNLKWVTHSENNKVKTKSNQLEMF
tara:strand:- start:146 stop:550 length:405 start_codon:yes stop_codon:yes gene_type:complete